jgi:hypothetical protein
MQEAKEYKCLASPLDKDGFYADEPCGKDAVLMVKYEARFWPQNYGQLLLCETHHAVIWNLIKDLWEV